MASGILVIGLESQNTGFFQEITNIAKFCSELKLLWQDSLNESHVLTYEQIYRSVWGEEAFGSINNAIKCHIRNLRGKLYAAEPETPFSIRCVREVGYCLEVDSEKRAVTSAAMGGASSGTDGYTKIMGNAAETVHSDGRVVFTFRNGAEVSTEI